MADVVEIDSLAELQSYRLTWDALRAATPGASFFHDFDWFDAYWRHFGGGKRMRVLLIRAAGKPLGIVPLCVEKQRRQLGSVRVLTYPLDGWGTSYSPIGSCHAATLALAMRHIAGTPRDWDLIELPWVEDPRTDRGHTARAMKAAGLSCVVEEHETTSSIDLATSWDDYLAGLGSKTRHKIRRTLRQAPSLGQDAGGVEHLRWRATPQAEGGGDPAWDLYDECEAVARDSWQAESTDGNTLCHDKYRPFLRDAHTAAARRGIADINLLRIGGRAVAFNYNYVTEGRVFGLRTGYRKDAPKGAGATLMYMTLKDSFERGDTRYELGAGDQEYKQRIRTGSMTTCRLTHTPITSWRSQAVRLGRWVRSHRGSKQPGKAPAGAKCS